jgi:glycosyltransferase involved in cell wall biosynthesis
MKRVLIIEAQMKQYRMPFYEGLHRALCADGFQLTVAYSEPTPEELEKRDNCELPHEYGVKVKAHWICGERILFQPLFREIISADLVIIDHANKFVLNHALLWLSLAKLKKVAYWGLGENLQEDRSAFSEWYKKLTLNWVDGWLAYTAGTAKYLTKQGVPQTKIVAVQNSVDTRGIGDRVRSLTPGAREKLRADLGIPRLAPLGIFVGMLHKVKSMPFLVQAGKRIRETAGDFHLIVAGGGPDEETVRKAAAQENWIHFVGPKFGDEKSELLGIADLFLLPGRVGLAILDCFAAGLPLVATRLPIHGPEMEYLEEGCNGILTEHHSDAYADAVTDLLLHPQKLQHLQEGARLSAEKYSIEAMIENFNQGILQCLPGSGKESLFSGDTRSRSFRRNGEFSRFSCAERLVALHAGTKNDATSPDELRNKCP